MIRLRQRSSGSYALTVGSQDDAGADLEVASATVSIYDSAGTTVVDTAAATVTAAVDPDPGSISYALDATTVPLLDTYRAVFTATLTAGGATDIDLDFEVVGGFLFSLAELRGRDSSFTNTTKYPDAVLAVARVRVEQTIEGPQAARVAFVPRGRRVTLDGTNRAGIRLPDFEVREIYSASVDGTALTSDELADLIIDDGVLWRSSGVWRSGRRNVVLHYAHGLDFPPGPINRAALTLAREYLVDPGIDLGRATATTVGDQTYRLTIAGRDGVTGLPEVDAAIEQHGRSRLMMG